MGDLGNFFDLNDYNNARKSWLESAGKSQKQVRVFLFQGYEVLGNQTNPNETFRKPKYVAKSDYVWLSSFTALDMLRDSRIQAGDLECYSEFLLRGFSSSYLLPNSVKVDEYAGDLIDWNGKLWEISDQLEPVTWGVQTQQVWYRVALRRTQRSGIGTEVGAS